MAKEKVNFNHRCEILKTEDEKRLVYGKVLVPDTIDKQLDTISKDDVERVAHEFMMGFQKSIYPEIQKSEMGYLHKNIGGQDLYVVESWIDKSDGSWWLGTYVENDEIWEQIKSGEITGYSIGGTAYRVPIENN